MEKEKVNQIILSDGMRYTGWGYYQQEEFVPDGCGKKLYDGYYEYGNFNNGVLDGPAVVSHDYYMHTIQFKNNHRNGWGLHIDRGDLVEFGYYKDSKLIVDVTDFALWYFTNMKAAGRNDNMLTVYTFNETHYVAEILIGYRGTMQNGVGLQFMGFHFMADGSVWMGNTNTRSFTGVLVHFRNDGYIDCGRFVNGALIETLDIQKAIDIQYYGIPLSNNKFAAELWGTKYQIREQFRNIPSIINGYNYFEGLPMEENSASAYDNSDDNQYKMTYHVNSIDYNANGNFKSFNEENWIVGEKSIITPHGTLYINDAIFVEQGSLVGIQFSVTGKLKLNEFSCSTGRENDVEIGTFALMRQPHNAWLWTYAFDEYANPLVNFCGFDDLDGFANLVPFLKRIYKIHK